MSNFLFTFGVIALGLLLGYTIQILLEKGTLRPSLDVDRLRKFLLKSALLFFLPVTVIGAVWTIKIDNPKLVTLPFLGVFALLLGGFLAIGVSGVLRLGRKQTGSFFVCGSFTNIGAVGGLICYAFLGETGFGLVPIYRLFEEFVYYGVGFPIARLYGSEVKAKETSLTRFQKLILDPLILVSVSSIAAGGALNLSGIARPEFYRTVNAILIPVTTIVFLVPIGLVMKMRRVGNYLKECLAMSVIKFLAVPLVVTFVALILGYQDIAEGLLLKIVIILSSMPVAFMALVPPSLYDLDIDLANSCWFFTTALLVVVLPVLFFIIQWV